MEVVCAVGLLSVILVPMLRFADVAQGNALFQRQMMALMADIQIEACVGGTYWAAGWNEPACQQSGVTTVMGQLDMTVTTVLVDYEPPSAKDDWVYKDQLKKLIVTVECQNCVQPRPVVRKVAVVGKAQ